MQSVRSTIMSQALQKTQSLGSMTTSVLTLEQLPKAPESHSDQLSNGGSVLNLKKTAEKTKDFPPNGNVLSNGRVKTLTEINLFSQKLKEFESYFVTELIWLNIIAITAIHITAFVCAFFALKTIKWQSIAFGFFTGGCAGFGVTAGVHRLWCHRAYTANVPLRIILMICYSMAGQNPIYDWVRDHRVHHKYSETAADPHDANRGFFFAHVGWLMCRKRREVLDKGRTVDMSDVVADPVVKFHSRFFLPMKLAFCIILPTIIPIYFWNETIFNSVATEPLMRYVMSLNFTWLVNSAAHMWGNKPYDKHISPVQNWSVSLVAMGEGWHNYHHVFPWDYRAAELGNYRLNVTTMWLDFFARIGWATDLKTATPSLVKAVVERKGDGSHDVYNLKEEKGL